MLHMFHVFAKILEIVPDSTAKNIPRIPITELKPSDVLANQEHFKQLKALFVIICIRIATKRIPELQIYSKYVTKHINHEYSDVLQHASVTVKYYFGVKKKEPLIKFSKTTNKIVGPVR